MSEVQTCCLDRTHQTFTHHILQWLVFDIALSKGLFILFLHNSHIFDQLLIYVDKQETKQFVVMYGG